ncbi:outer membrane lipoprotein-sorting protein [Pontiella agarivorans]|uniref:Outer membrane lipoprotein-sorting protein n=1 Tax=Pontiella agarivorans TaxID=3038953 RepID=A0ABU5MVL2_9BACT|nr:outer membrane lipoprotein-sorting protein [Pontiella agarivorans]MDZ8118254.1 outer membrane lipoprotein-sorting protein [Pontiella agarivorans]
MKNILLAGTLLVSTFSFAAEQPSADHILSMVQKKLPSRPLKLTGKLKAKAKNGFTKSYPVTMELDWHAAPATAHYKIDKEELTITWQNDRPNYTFSEAGQQPTSEIMGTGFTWADLSFSVLWWPNSRLIGEDKKLNRDTYIIDVPIPGSENIMRLWVDQYMGMVMEAQTLDKAEKQLTRLKIKSIKKMDGMWIAKDLELSDKQSGRKTTLQISDLKWMDEE